MPDQNSSVGGISAGEAYQDAIHTVQRLREFIGTSRWTHTQELIDALRTYGTKLQEEEPAQAVIGNMVRRVFFMVREEHERARQGRAEEAESLQGIVAGTTSASSLNEIVPNLKGAIMEALQELMSELDSCGENIAAQALEHIHSNEVIMTLGHCRTVEAFLLRAAKKRKFQVMVVESAPDCSGHLLAASLAEANIETTVISDAAVAAIMARVNKIIVGTSAVLADGGLKARAGTHALALAARRHAVPLIVCTAMYKLSPRFRAAHDEPGFQHCGGPQAVISCGAPAWSPALPPGVHVLCPAYDYVPPELVTLFISNLGGHSPSYVYRLLSELYHPSDTLVTP